MSLIRSALLSLAIAAATAGCDDNDNPLSPTERQDLIRARARWAELGSANYTVESRILCFCPPHMVYWTRLTVQAGQVVAAQPLETLPNGWEPSIQGWQTVEQLFDIVHDSPGAIVKDIKVQFDAQLGYPLKVETICYDNIADCGTVREMRNLQITP